MQISPDVLCKIASFPITNTVLATLATDFILVIAAFAVCKVCALRPASFQNIIEIIIDYFYNTAEEIAGKKANFIYPWVVTFFLFILVSNIAGQLPGLEDAFEFFAKSPDRSEKEVSLFRSATSDLNLTLAFAVISVVVTNFMGIKHLGIKGYISKFISFKMFPILLFVGLLEFVNEFTKVISFSFRLFGNIFAGGSVMGAVYRDISGILAPVPFMALELMVAVIQALVFAMLTMSFMHIMTDSSH
jgi:F-type H+-transporting ATPase subunit a